MSEKSFQLNALVQLYTFKHFYFIFQFKAENMVGLLSSKNIKD